MGKAYVCDRCNVVFRGESHSFDEEPIALERDGLRVVCSISVLELDLCRACAEEGVRSLLAEYLGVEVAPALHDSELLVVEKVLLSGAVEDMNPEDIASRVISNGGSKHPAKKAPDEWITPAEARSILGNEINRDKLRRLGEKGLIETRKHGKKVISGPAHSRYLRSSVEDYAAKVR